jgi:predicted phage terminase large subunit-like protein
MLVSRKWLANQGIAQARSFDDLTLADVITSCEPTFDYPHHLAELVESLDEMEHSVRQKRVVPVRVCVEVAPQFAKTKTISLALARFLARNPTRRNGYISYSMDRAREISQDVRGYTMELGVPLAPGEQKQHRWRTEQGGGLIAAGIGGALTGERIDGVMIVDDPYKDEKDADSLLYRERVWNWSETVMRTRLHPGACVLIVHTRWHRDDVIGRIRERMETGKLTGWRFVSRPAILPNGESLWPEHRPISFLEDIRREIRERAWWALYMQQPIPDGGAVFGPATTCDLDDVPTVGAESVGIDLAYSPKSTADESAAVALRRGHDGLIYVIDVWSDRLRPTDGVTAINRFLAQHPGPALWYTSGQESHQMDALRAIGLNRVRAETTSAPKKVRAMECATAWEKGRIVVPRDAAWSARFLAQVTGFTGLGDRHDDLVDALVAAYDALPALDSGTVASARPRRRLWGAM